MSAAPKRLAGPAYLSNSAADIYEPPAITMYVVLRLIHFCNTDTSPHQVTLYIGADDAGAAGTELFKTFSIPANSVYTWPCYIPMASTDFLTGFADTASKVTIMVSGDQYVFSSPS